MNKKEIMRLTRNITVVDILSKPAQQPEKTDAKDSKEQPPQDTNSQPPIN